MPFEQASSNPFQLLPGGALSIKSNDAALPPMGMPNAHATALHINSLGPSIAAVYPGKCLTVIEENDSGRNMTFQITITGQVLTLTETVGAIKNGQLPDYEICIINGVETPRSKPDGSTANNLG